MKINILGTEYSVLTKNEENDELLRNCNGYCDASVKEIIVCNMEKQKDDCRAVKDMSKYVRTVLTHEVVHAFLYESGLGLLYQDETLVEWIGLQLEKIYFTSQELIKKYEEGEY